MIYDLHTTTSTVFDWVMQAVIFGTVLCCVTALIVRVVGRRMSPTLHGALWLVVLIKFIVPIGPGWSMSLQELTAPATASFSTLWTGGQATSPIVSDSNAALAWLSMFGRQDSAGGAVAATTPHWPWTTWAVLVYALGVTAVLALRLRSYSVFVRNCRNSRLANPVTTRFVHAVCDRLGVRRRPVVRISERIGAPFIIGLWRPTLVLSCVHLNRSDELEAVVLHEVAHLRRGDMFVRYLQWFAGTVLFFWPVVAWVNRRIDLMREYACDVWALRHGQLSASAYARCLLRAAGPDRAAAWAYRPAAMAAGRKAIERRIDMILERSERRTRRARWTVLAAAGIVAWAGVALTGAATDEDTTPDAPQRHQKHRVRVAEAPLAAHVMVRAAAIEEGSEVGTLPEGFVFQTLGASLDMPMCQSFGMCKKKLAQFAEAHPQADVDETDGVSHSEYVAYVAVLAMRYDEKVLEKYPDADHDKDGDLSDHEAVAIASNSGPFPMLPPTKIDGSFGAIGMVIADDEGPERHDIVVQRHLKELIVLDKSTMATGQWTMKPPKTAADWILENANAEPTAREVTAMLEAVEAAPRVFYLKSNPDADSDEDGTLTQEEMDAHMEATIEALHLELPDNAEGVWIESSVHHNKTFEIRTDLMDEDGNVFILEGGEFGGGLFDVEVIEGEDGVVYEVIVEFDELHEEGEHDDVETEEVEED
jgi:beta-lactamase regulating signal transducer with metallopeptidase domain